MKDPSSLASLIHHISASILRFSHPPKTRTGEAFALPQSSDSRLGLCNVRLLASLMSQMPRPYKRCNDPISNL